jgi:hypothetical protein
MFTRIRDMAGLDLGISSRNGTYCLSSLEKTKVLNTGGGGYHTVPRGRSALAPLSTFSWFLHLKYIAS